MGNIGRYVCVALPFALTLAAIIAMLVAGLAGVADKSLYMFNINTQNLTITSDMLKQLAGSLTSRDAAGTLHNVNLLGSAAAAASGSITAENLGLANSYDISLWGYCSTPQNGERTCIKPAYNWAEATMDNFTDTFKSAAAVAGMAGANITLPTEIQHAMDAFAAVSRWTEIVFIIAYVLLGVELFFGIFANCSRAWSCVTWVFAGLATTATCAAAALATAMSSIVIGAVEGSAKAYGVTGSVNTRFLVAVWVGAAFAIAAGFFWIFTICCCKPEHRSYGSGAGGRTKHLDESSSYLSGPYQPIHDPEHNSFYNQNQHASQYGAPRYPAGGRSDLAYEPYSHSHSHQ